MSAKQSILFVDDEVRVLRGLRRALSCMRTEWDMVFVESGREALEVMSERTFDVVVSDMRMPGMSGVELLNEVRKRYPQTVRLALSGQSSKESVLQSVGPIHQYLPKPCEVDDLKEILSRVWTIRGMLAVPKLQSLLTELERLPSLPSLYEALMAEFRAPDGSLKEVGRIVAQDVGMSAKVLQMVNSAFFGVRRHVSSPAQAVAALGMNTVKSLALAVCVFAPFEERVARELAIEPLWRHSLAVGSVARQIATVEGQPAATIDHSLVAGLLHDVGKLVLAAVLPDDYAAARRRAEREEIGLADAELQDIGATHAQIGAYLLGLWGFGEQVLQAVAYHHRPAQAGPDGFGPLVAVHAASALVHEQSDCETIGAKPALDHELLDRLGLSGRLPVWAQACQDALLQEVSP